MADHRAGALLIALLAAVTTACGGGTTATPQPAPASPTAQPAATAKATTPIPATSARLENVLFAVLEPGAESQPNTTVAITGIDGLARAKATFAPRALPRIGNAFPFTQLEAHTAAGAVYFMDGSGAVRRLSPDGANQPVTSFPITQPQQLAAFAVSPDGRRLAASVLTLPPRLAEPQPFGGWPAGARASVLIEVASAGGQAQTIQTLDLGPIETAKLDETGLTIAGWDGGGPVALNFSLRGTQQGYNGYRALGVRSHLDEATGKPTGPPLGGPGCVSWGEAANGTVGCGVYAGQAFSIRAADGTVLYEFTAEAGNFIYPALSPDGSRTAVFQTGNDINRTTIQSKQGGKRLSVGFQPEGWLDADTLIGHNPGGNLAYLRLATPDRVEDLGFKGTFAGIVKAG